MRTIMLLVVCSVISWLALNTAQAATPEDQLNGQRTHDRILYDYFNFDGSDELKGGVVLKKRPAKLTGRARIAAEEKLYAAVSTVETIVNSGAPANRVDIVIMGDGYTSADIAAYRTKVRDFVGWMFEYEPFAEYKNYFNVHRIDVVSKQSGVDNDPTNGIKKDTALNSYYWCGGTQRLICTDIARTALVAKAAPAVDQRVVLIKSNTWGGAGYPGIGLCTAADGFGRSTSYVMIHELGHALGKLADEYDYDGATTWTYGEPGERNVSIYQATSMAANEVKWYRWLNENNSSYNGLISTYEGADYSRYGIYRPTKTSAMRSSGYPFNLVSIEALIGEIYKKVTPIDFSTSNLAALKGNDYISVRPMKPVSAELTIRWYVDNQEVVGALGKSSFRASDYDVVAGTHTVTAFVEDPTPFVRDPQLRANYLQQRKSWTVVVGNTLAVPTITTLPQDTTIVDGLKGQLVVAATSPTPVRYQWYKNGVLIRNATGRTLTVTGAAVNNNAYYTCALKNKAGTVYTPAVKVSVVAPTAPEITSQPVSILVQSGKTATFKVTATSTGALSYQWQRNKVNIRGATRPYYAIRATKALTGSAYRCIVTGKAGSVTSWPAYLVSY